MGMTAGRRHSVVRLTAPTNARVQETTKAKASAIADTLGISLSAYLDALIARDQLDDDGRPIWWDEATVQHPELFRMTG